MKRAWSLAWVARFVSRWEGWLPTAYLDRIAVPNVYTIGFGHVGSDVHPGMTITKARGLVLLTRDLRTAARAVARNIHVPLSVRQRMALISLAFNCGAGAVEGSSLQRDLNRSNYKAAADRFLEWDHAGGVEVEGLKNRRVAERAMFLSKPKTAHRMAKQQAAKRKAAIKKGRG